MFTATWLQTATYLLAVCPCSIAFLVFMNSSVSFVITDLINLESGTGDAAGTLGFADELLALVTCPVWGIMSDHIGVRYVCTIGYAIIALSLVLFVQATSVYPGLLLGRLLFCLGGSAVATMVTAILPSITANKLNSTSVPYDGVVDSNTQNGIRVAPNQTCPSAAPGVRTDSSSQPSPSRFVEKGHSRGSAPRLAGFVGMLTGCGALIALLLFLPLPARFEKLGYSAAQSIKFSFYVVALVALVVSIVCFFGLRGIRDDEGKGLNILVSIFRKGELSKQGDINEETRTSSEFAAGPGQRSSSPPACHRHSPLKYFMTQFILALRAGGADSDISLAYIGGFVARASSVGISLFIPLYVNQYYRHSGLCYESNHFLAQGQLLNEEDLGEIKKSCPKAYIAASILTGLSQLTALVFAPMFGFLSDKSRTHHFPLLVAALAGIFGYIWLSVVPEPQINGLRGNASIFICMALIGFSQIGSIVCSLATLSNGMFRLTNLNNGEEEEEEEEEVSTSSNGEERETSPNNHPHGIEVDDEYSHLLPNSRVNNSKPDDLLYYKGSISGMYSFFGGVGILLLTKLGGLLFDKASPNSPFYILAGFNGLLLVSGLLTGLRGHRY